MDRGVDCAQKKYKCDAEVHPNCHGKFGQTVYFLIVFPMLIP